MTDSDNRQIAPGPSSNSLFKSAFFTLLGAVLATVLFIMPAEYGVDPTGLGTKLGLTDLEQTAPDPVPAGSVSSSEDAPKLIAGAFPSAPAEDDFDFFDPEVMSDPFSRSHSSPFRTDTIEVPLDEFEHVEVKANMKQGDALVYSWKLVEGDTVYTDFHADPHHTDQYPMDYWVRYAESEDAAASGSIVAPFDGNHGWYWMNIEENPVKVILEVRGYYESLDEIMRAYQ
ncbi:MAG: hypothetical protein OSB26_05595 [Woeseiaceae bacterium]|jgi:hypothetical protein|nr:hypothetical protein [Woeseiaceae bacterium]|tara:strand:+ start:457 stop:1143 length:687 start_codon:yes stop_codon:yes gene_type:complete